MRTIKGKTKKIEQKKQQPPNQKHLPLSEWPPKKVKNPSHPPSHILLPTRMVTHHWSNRFADACGLQWQFVFYLFVLRGHLIWGVVFCKIFYVHPENWGKMNPF